MDLLQVGGQVTDLGSFPAPFDPFEGDEKAQISPIYKINETEKDNSPQRTQRKDRTYFV